ncbi:thioredoxin family protein [bacterium]|nr:thioredoxin family protein [bacterium]
MNQRTKSIIILSLGVVLLVIVFTVIPWNKQKLPDSPQTEDVAQEQPSRPVLPTMLELGSEGCIPCEQMKPVMAQLTEEHGELIYIKFHDVRKDKAIAQQYGIRLIPTQIFLMADGTEFFRHEGFFPKDEIEKVFRDMGVSI